MFFNNKNLKKLIKRKRLENKAQNNSVDYSNRNISYDIIGFLLFLFSGILLLSYVSMSMDDINSNANIKNLLGIFGAYISYYSFISFGFTSIIIPILLGYIGFNTIVKNKFDNILLPSSLTIIFMILFSTFLNIILGSINYYFKGGIIGQIIGDFLISIFGGVGAFLIIVSFFIVGAIAFFKLSLLSLSKKVLSTAKSIDVSLLRDRKNHIFNYIYNIINKKVDNNVYSSDKKEENYDDIIDDSIEIVEEEKVPFFSKRESYSSIPFIEKKDTNNFFDEDKYREELKQNSRHSFDVYYNDIDDNIKNFCEEYDEKREREIAGILGKLRSNSFDINYTDNSNDDIGIILVEAVFGFSNADKLNNNDSLNYNKDLSHSINNSISFNDNNEDMLEINFNTHSASDFKKAIYNDSNNFKYNVNKSYIKATTSADNSYNEYISGKSIFDNNTSYNDDTLYSESEDTVKMSKTNEEIKDDVLSKLRNIVERNKKNSLHNNISYNSYEDNYYEEEYENISEENNNEYDSYDNNEVKPFEFSMGYASKREYNREDHIPNFRRDVVRDFNNKEENVFNNEYNNNGFLDEDKLINNFNSIEDDIESNIDDEEHNTFVSDDVYSDIDNNFDSFDGNISSTVSPTMEETNEEVDIENYIEDIKEDINTNRFSNIKEEENNNVNTFNKKTYILKPTTTNSDFIQSNFDSNYVDKHYSYPPIDLLNKSVPVNDNAMLEAIKQTAIQLENTLLDFNIEAKVTGVSRGPVITRYELELAAGTRVSKISNLTDNIALALASESVRIIAPIPGRSVIGIEIPNKVRNAVFLRDVLESSDFRSSKLEIPFVLGKGIYGNNVITDMSDAPHLLVAGTTGSGKSVCLSTIILSLLYKFRPDELKFIFVDKKRVELSIYNGIPHLMSPVVSDEKKATIVLRYIVDIMEKRYERMERFFVRNVKTYNEKVKQLLAEGETEFNGEPLELFPYIVLVIDELHNLMVVASKEVEDLISRLAGMSRAVGIHLIIATQRPSADVVTGVIKANLPTRIAFQVPNKTNSRIIIDMSGAEQLLGKGDALFCASGSQMPERIQGAFVSDNEVKKVVDYLSGGMSPLFDESLIAALEGSDDDKNTDEEDILDEVLWEDAVKLVARTGKASASFLQRRLKIGYNRAARIVEIMERQGIVGPENGSKPREVLISID